MEECSSHLRDCPRWRLPHSLWSLGSLWQCQIPFDADAILPKPRVHLACGLRDRSVTAPLYGSVRLLMNVVASMFYYSAVLLWPQQVSVMYTTDIDYAGWLSVSCRQATRGFYG